jgi:hypothetical protein
MTYWARWYMPIILVTWETEAGESWVQGLNRTSLQDPISKTKGLRA